VAHVCPWWGGYLIDNRLRRLIHDPGRILAPYVAEGMTVMDFGCGMGLFALEMARMVGPHGLVVAVDVQPRMLDEVKVRARRQGLAERVQTRCSGAESLGFHVHVDFCLAFYSLHEVRGQRRMLEDLYLCLRPCGRLLWVEPVGHVPAKTFARMIESAEEVGFRATERPSVRWSHAVVLACR